jgi:UDP-N-acetylmuramoylalanine--D-glutamate ligase
MRRVPIKVLKNFSSLKDQAVFRPTGFADLADKRVGVFGYGVEGRATVARLAGVGDVVIVDDNPNLGPLVTATSEGGLEKLRHCDVVLKSPGIPRQRADVLDLETHGVTVTSALNLWLQESDRARVIGVTGTKGKSTTTALITFFLHCLGQDAQCLGNIGRPPYDPDVDTSKGWIVLEVSSFQCVDLDVAPGVVVVTSLGADHLDWHGSLERYQSDKLSLTRAQGDHRTLVADEASLHEVHDQLGGEVTFVARDDTGLATALGLIGAHNDTNVALALAAVEALTGLSVGDVRASVAAKASHFEPLRGRLTLVASEEVDGVTVRYVDDGLATSVLPTVAALEVFANEPVALIAGGFDRGIDYEELAHALTTRSQPIALITMGNAGARIGASVRALDPQLRQRSANSMREAVELARESLESGGVVLLSPAAPSFDQYQNWEERSDDFTRVATSFLRD